MGVVVRDGSGSASRAVPGSAPDYISLPPIRYPEAALRETFASRVSPRWPRGEGGALARAAVAVALERGEIRDLVAFPVRGA